MKRAIMTVAVAMCMFVVAPAHAQSVVDCSKGPSENYVKCLEAVTAALRSDLDKFKLDVGNKAFQGDVDQIRHDIASLKGKVAELEGRIGMCQRRTEQAPTQSRPQHRRLAPSSFSDCPILRPADTMLFVIFSVCQAVPISITGEVGF